MLSERSALLGLWTSEANPKIRRGLEEILRETHRLLGKYLTDRVAAGELRPQIPRAVVQALFASCAFGHGIGQPVDPLAVAHIVLEGIAVTRAAPAHAAPVLKRRVRSAKKSLCPPMIPPAPARKRVQLVRRAHGTHLRK